MSCNKKVCSTKCSRKAGVEVTATPKILCSQAAKHECAIPVELEVCVKPRCSLVKAPCAKSTDNCRTKCKYQLMVSMDIEPKVDIGCAQKCTKFFEFETAVDYATRCINPSSSSSSSSSCAPCQGKAPHKYRKSCKCSSCNAWRKAH